MRVPLFWLYVIPGWFLCFDCCPFCQIMVNWTSCLHPTNQILVTFASVLPSLFCTVVSVVHQHNSNSPNNSAWLLCMFRLTLYHWRHHRWRGCRSWPNESFKPTPSTIKLLIVAWLATFVAVVQIDGTMDNGIRFIGIAFIGPWLSRPASLQVPNDHSWDANLWHQL